MPRLLTGFLITDGYKAYQRLLSRLVGVQQCRAHYADTVVMPIRRRLPLVAGVSGLRYWHNPAGCGVTLFSPASERTAIMVVVYGVPRKGPLAPYAEGVAGELGRLGFTPASVRLQLEVACRGVSPCSLSSVRVKRACALSLLVIVWDSAAVFGVAWPGLSGGSRGVLAADRCQPVGGGGGCGGFRATRRPAPAGRSRQERVSCLLVRPGCQAASALRDCARQVW